MQGSSQETERERERERKSVLSGGEGKQEAFVT